MARADDLARGLLEVAFASLFKLTFPLRPDTAGLLPLPMIMREVGMGLLALPSLRTSRRHPAGPPELSEFAGKQVAAEEKKEGTQVGRSGRES